jgi:hypothetical protein
MADDFFGGEKREKLHSSTIFPDNLSNFSIHVIRRLHGMLFTVQLAGKIEK